MRTQCLRKLCLLILLGAGAPSGGHANSASFEAGGSQHARLIRLGIQSKWNARWWQSNGTHVSGYWDATLAHWRGDRYRNEPGRAQNITAIGITPVVRLQTDSGKGLYAEAGIGLHFLSELYDNNGRQLSTRLQFGDHLAIGYIFSNDLDLGLKLQHFSNGSFKKPNDGLNFAIIRIAYPF